MQSHDPDPQHTITAPPVIPDAVRVQILATEHWGLLATRSMIWNEMFTRTGMFLTTLSAAAVALALVAQATDFGQNFRTFALIVLPVVLLLGIGTYIRLNDSLVQDFWLVIGMNRLRHAYHGIAPDVAPYFITSGYDDLVGIVQSYSMYDEPTPPRVTPGRVLSSTAVIVGILDCVVAGLVVALTVALFTDQGMITVGSGVGVGFVCAVLMIGVIPYRLSNRLQGDYRPRFPREPAQHGAPGRTAG